MILSSTSIGISCTTFPTTQGPICYPPGARAVCRGDGAAASSRAGLVPRMLIGRDDRFFPAELQRRVAKDRLGSMPMRSQAVTWLR